MMSLTTEPLWLSAVLLVIVAPLLAMAGPALIRRRLPLARLRTNNEVAGFKFATVGVLFAVLLAFAVVIVWEKFNDAENDVARESGAAATIYRLAHGIGAEQEKAIRGALNAYLTAVVEKDWPAMAQGEDSSEATRALDRAYEAVLANQTEDRRGTALMTEMLRELDLLTQGRRARLVMASGVVPGVIWLVLFGGALVTISFTFFFAAENLIAQTMMTGMLAVLIFSGLLVIIAIDHPFAGTVRVEPEPIIEVLEDLGGAPAP